MQRWKAGLERSCHEDAIVLLPILLRTALQTRCNRWNRSGISISLGKCPVGFGACENLCCLHHLLLRFTTQGSAVRTSHSDAATVDLSAVRSGDEPSCVHRPVILNKSNLEKLTLYFRCIDQFFLLGSASRSLILHPPLHLALSSQIFCPNLHLFLYKCIKFEQWETDVMLFWGVGKFIIYHKTCLCGITNVVVSRLSQNYNSADFSSSLCLIVHFPTCEISIVLCQSHNQNWCPSSPPLAYLSTTPGSSCSNYDTLFWQTTFSKVLCVLFSKWDRSCGIVVITITDDSTLSTMCRLPWGKWLYMGLARPPEASRDDRC